jgi:hypothetical protein
VTGLTLIRSTPTADDRVAEIVTVLRGHGLRSMAQYRGDEQYAAVIVPAPGGPQGHGQYRVAPHGALLRVHWVRRDRSPVPVADVDTADQAAGLIIDHMTGRYP